MKTITIKGKSYIITKGSCKTCALKPKEVGRCYNDIGDCAIKIGVEYHLLRNTWFNRLKTLLKL